MEPKFDKFAIIAQTEQTLDALVDASGIRKALLIGNIYNLLENLRNGLNEETKAQEAKINELMRVIEERKQDGRDGENG